MPLGLAGNLEPMVLPRPSPVYFARLTAFPCFSLLCIGIRRLIPSTKSPRSGSERAPIEANVSALKSASKSAKASFIIVVCVSEKEKQD